MIYDEYDYIKGMAPIGSRVTCPFHDDRHASGSVLPNGRFWCHACCLNYGQIEMAKMIWFKDLPWGAGMRMAQAFIKKENWPIVSKPQRDDDLPIPALDPHIADVMNTWIRFCNDHLRTQPHVVKRIRLTRGIKDPIGLGMGAASADVYRRLIREIGEDEETLVTCGIVQKQGYNFNEPLHRRYRLTNRLIIPEYRGTQAVYYQGRAQVDLPGRKRYLNPPLTRPVFGWDSLQRDTGFVWLLEGVFDILPLIEEGEAAISINGLGFNENIFQEFKTMLRGRPVAVIFDNDPLDINGHSPGIEAGRQRVERFKEEGIEAVQMIPPNKDVGEWIVAQGVQRVIKSVSWEM